MCADDEFDPERSDLVLGPINKPRWIYACAKQLMDRVIHAYGLQEGLKYTLFRPFNWIGPGLDSLHTPKEGSSRVITQFLGHIVRGEPIQLVGTGMMARCVQHETDHLDGVLFIDRLDAKARKEAMKAIRATDWYEAGMTIKMSPHAGAGKAD